MIFSKFTRVFVGLAGAVLLMPFISFAQVDGASVSGAGQELAQLNLGEAAIMGETPEVVTVTFVLENIGTVPQSDIRYGAELVLVTDGTVQVTADSFVSHETDSLPAGGKVAKVIEYPLSGIAPGSYDLWVTARTTGGMVLGLAKAGNVSVASSEAVSFVTETCVLTIDGVDAEYHLAQGVDVSSGETLELVCDVKNYGATTKSVVPVFETFKRSVFGTKEALSYPAQAAQTIAAGEQKTLTFALPKSTVPQAYEARIALTEEGSSEVVSNHVAAHYVLRGASATIQSINFDKASYVAGETITFSMFWTGPADAFFDSRAGTGTAMVGDVRAEIAVTDEAGAVCTSPISKIVSPGEVVLTAVATTNCMNPKATISLVDAAGSVLDNRSIEVKEEVVAASEEAGSVPSNKTPYMLIVFISLALVALVTLVVVTRHKKVDVTTAAKLLVLTVLTAGSLFGGAADAEAATWNHRWSNSEGWHNHSVTVNTNKTTYSPNETITLSSLIYNADCANNSIPVHRLIATLQGTTITLSENPTANSSGNKYGGGTFIAPGPGTYTIALRMTTLNRNEHSYANITITVVAPVVAAVGNFESVTPSTCSVAGWAYDPDASASSVVIHVYRDGAAGAGGTYVGSCTANQSRPDVNTAYSISGNHGFNCSLPASYIGTGNHNLYVHAIDINGSPNNVIASSPRAMNCLPAPTATISGACSARIPVGESSCSATLSWEIQYATFPKVVSLNPTNTFSTVAIGINQPITIPHGDKIIEAHDGSIVLDSVTITAECALGSSWVGGVCTATVAPTASISVDTAPCYISVGDTTCSTNVTWDIDSASSPNVRNTFTNTSISTDLSGTSPEDLDRGVHTFVAYDGATALDSVNVTVDCEAGSSWVGGVCTATAVLPAPVIDLELSRELIRSGETVDVTVEVTAEYTTQCTVYGVASTPIVFTHNGTPASPVSSEPPFTSRPLTSAQIVTVTCEPNPANGAASNTETSRVDVIPVVQEV